MALFSYKSIPLYELLETLAFDVWGDTAKLVNYWPPEFMRDSAFVHPEFALKCVDTDLLWNCFNGCVDEIADICKVNSTAAWYLIRKYFKVHLRQYIVNGLQEIFHLINWKNCAHSYLIVIYQSIKSIINCLMIIIRN